MKSFFRKFINSIKNIKQIDSKLDDIQLAIGKIELRQLHQFKIEKLTDAEFKIFSQWGEDGIIQYLIQKVAIEREIFIEFGVENYTESNTKFLLMNNNWSGLVFDSSEENINFIKNDPIYWKYDLKAKYAFITSENINFLISQNNITGDIGLLSIDVDGNDYWIWKSINCINPRIMIIEYNNLFGPHVKISIPYDSSFNRTKSHFSNLYFGASMSALCDLAESKGYSMVGSNNANIFFIRKDILNDLPKLSPIETWKKCKCRQSRDQKGNLTYIDHKEELALISEMPVFNFENGKIVRIRELNIEH